MEKERSLSQGFVVILGCIFLFLILGTVAVVSAPGDNLLDNPGFETPSPANWESKDAGSPPFWLYSWPTSPTHSGDHSVGIDINVSSYDGWWQSTPAVPITTTKPYSFSGWIKTEGVADQAFLQLHFLDITGTEVLTMDSNAVSGTTDWVQVFPSEPVVAPTDTDTVSARIRCQLSGAGMAWYDDIFLSPYGFSDLGIEKSAEPITVTAGERLTYTLRYSNTGNISAQGVVITDSLPLSVTFDFSNPSPDEKPDDHTLVWDEKIGDLAADGVPHTITVVVTVTNTIENGQCITNTATIAAENAISDTARITTEVSHPPKLIVDKKSSADSVSINDTLLYTLTYRNEGGAIATGVRLTDSLPLGVASDSSNPPLDEKPDDHTLVWDEKIGDLAADGVPHTITVVVMVTNAIENGQCITNTTTIAAENAISATAWITTEVTPTTQTLIYLPVVMKCFPPPCNGGFEDGWTGWTHGGELHQSISSDYPHSGNFSALLGDPAYNCENGVPEGSAWIEREVSIPSTVSPTLLFWYRIFTHDLNANLVDEFDSFDVEIDGVRVFRAADDVNYDYGCDQPAKDLGWQRGEVSLSAYRGKEVTIRFKIRSTDGWFNTWTYVDHIQVFP